MLTLVIGLAYSLLLIEMMTFWIDTVCEAVIWIFQDRITVYLMYFNQGWQESWHLWDTPIAKHAKKYMLKLKLLIKLELPFVLKDISVYLDEILSISTQAF